MLKLIRIIHQKELPTNCIFFSCSKHIFSVKKVLYQNIVNESLEKLKNVETIKKNGLFYHLPPIHISLNPLQDSRYEIKDQNILLFENINREKKILESLEILKTKKELFIGGATGLGKSHFFSLLVCHLTKKIKSGSESAIYNFDFEKFFQVKGIRVLYINNPNRYFEKLKFYECIIPDLIYAFGQDYHKPEFSFIKNVFEETDFKNYKNCLRAIEKICDFYENHGIIPMVGLTN